MRQLCSSYRSLEKERVGQLKIGVQESERENKDVSCCSCTFGTEPCRARGEAEDWSEKETGERRGKRVKSVVVHTCMAAHVWNVKLDACGAQSVVRVD